MHSFNFSLETCGKYLAKRGKLAKLSGLNIVIFTKIAINERIECPASRVRLQ